MFLGVAHRRLQAGDSTAEALGTAQEEWATEKQHNRTSRPEPETRAVHTEIAAGKAKADTGTKRYCTLLRNEPLYPTGSCHLLQ